MNKSEKAVTRGDALPSEKVRTGNAAAVSVSSQRGFTLVELFMVMAIISALVVMFMPALNHLRERAKVARAMEEMRGLERDISAYATERGGVLPLSLLQIGHAGMLDPWGHPYVYTPPNAADEEHPRRYFVSSTAYLSTDFDLYSKGTDGFSDADTDNPLSTDDVVRAGEGSFIGPVYKMNSF